MTQQNPRPQDPSEAFAHDEQHRADGLAARLGEITAKPSHPSRGSVPHYQRAYQVASATAAAHTEQPDGRPT